MLLALALLFVSIRWCNAEIALAKTEKQSAQYLAWLEKAQKCPTPTACPAPIPCPAPPAVVPCLPPPAELLTVCAGERRLPNGICLDVEVRPGDHPSYEIAFAFHRPEGGWAYKKLLTDHGTLPSELSMMSLNESDWKFLRASIPKPCPMALAPCLETARLEGPSGVMTSLWRVVERPATSANPVLNARVCTSLDWKDSADAI